MKQMGWPAKEVHFSAKRYRKEQRIAHRIASASLRERTMAAARDVLEDAEYVAFRPQIKAYGIVGILAPLYRMVVQIIIASRAFTRSVRRFFQRGS